MPIYEYKCDDCSAQFEALRRITDETIPDCEECGSGNVHRLISLSSFHLKGSGWYVTDYGGKHHGSEPADESAKASSEESSGDSETKAQPTVPEKKADSEAPKKESKESDQSSG